MVWGRNGSGSWDHAEGREPLSWTKARARSTQENTFPKPWAGKMRGADFQEFLQPEGLEDWSFKDLRAWLG